jgi:hypothetical protein
VKRCTHREEEEAVPYPGGSKGRMVKGVMVEGLAKHEKEHRQPRRREEGVS